MKWAQHLGVGLVLVAACHDSDAAQGAGSASEGTDSATTEDSASGTTTSGSSISDSASDGSGGGQSSGAGPTSGSTSETDGDTLDTDADTESSSTGSPDSPLEPGIYVHPDGIGSNPGTAQAPLRTIQAGLEAAATDGLGAVYVAAGDYEASSDAGETVVIVSGVDVLGGFDPTNWDVRDPSVYVTRIHDPSTSGESPATAVEVTGVNDSTLDGLEIEAANVANSLAVLIRGGEPVIQRSTIRGEVRLTDGGSATLQDNRLEDPILAIRCLALGGPTPTPVARRNQIRGPVVWSCGGTLASSLIRGADDGGPAPARGLLALGGLEAARIVSNTIVLDRALAPPNTAVMAYGDGASVHELTNNNIIAPGRACISQEGSDFGNDPFVLASVRSNNLACDILHQRFGIVTNGNPWTTDGELVSVAGVHAQVDGAAGNVSEEPGVIDIASDGHLRTDGTVPCAVSRGGEIAAPTDADPDFDGVARTGPWSIGAFEYDGACL